MRDSASVNSWTGWAVSSLTAKFYKTQTKAMPTSSSAENKGTSAEATHREKDVSAKGELSLCVWVCIMVLLIGEDSRGEDKDAVQSGKPANEPKPSTDESWQDEEWEVGGVWGVVKPP